MHMWHRKEADESWEENKRGKGNTSEKEEAETDGSADQDGETREERRKSQKEEDPQKEDDAPMDTDDMPVLIRNDSLRGTKKKCIFNKNSTKPQNRKK